MADKLLTDDEVFGGPELLSDDDVFGPAPTQGAGGGRGMAPGKTAQQEAELLASTGARRGTMRGVNPYGAAEPVDPPKSVLERPYTEPIPDTRTPQEQQDWQRSMAQEQVSPRRRDEIRRQGEYVTGSKVGALAAAPEPSVVDGMVAATRAKPLDNSLPSALLERTGNALATVEDLRLSTVGGLFQTMELGADALRLLTARDNDGTLADLSGWADKAGELARKARSPELRQQAAELSQILQDDNANVATVVGYLVAHPKLLASQAAESAPIMLATGGAGRLAGSLVERLSLNALKAAPATPGVAERIAELSAAGARGAAVATETLLGAGGVYADVLREGGDPVKAANAAGLTAIGYALVGRATRGGAEGALASGERRGVLRTAGEEFLQESGQSLSETAGQAVGMGRELDIAQALRQATAEGTVGAVAGGGAAMLQGKAPELGTSANDRALGGALAADMAGRDFQPDAIAGYAARASDPRFYDPTFVDPRATVMPRAPRVEEMPTAPFTPEQTAAMAAESQARKQAMELAAQQADEAQQAAEKGEAAPPAAGQTAETVGIRGVAQGTIAAGAEAALQQNAQANAGAANATTPAPTAAAQPAGAAMPARQAGGAQPAASGSPVAALASRYESARKRLFNDAAIAERRAQELRSVGLSDEADKLAGRARFARESATVLPALEEPKDGPELRAFNRVADAFEELTGRRPVAYVDRSARASDGFFDQESGQFLVNLHRPQRSVAFTTFHEFQHLVRNQAEKGDAQAQRATQMLDQVWAMIPDAKKRSYAESYLFRGRIESGQMTVEQALADPVLKDEMLSDFMGGKADDATFWRELAGKDPKTFGSFAQRWIDTLGKIVKSLLGRVTGGNKDIEVVAAALERSKLVAEKVLREWAAMNPKLAQQQGVSSTIEVDAGTTNGQAQRPAAGRQAAAAQPAAEPVGQASPRRSGRDDAAGRGPDGSLAQAQVSDPVRVSYGVAREGATTAVGYHYSQQDRNTLASVMYGRGLAGAEADRLAGADQRLRQRIYFYLDRGTGINPEAGVGGRAHRVELRNLYDADEDALRLVRDSKGSNAFELAVIEAGFDGWLTRDAGPSGNAVLLGSHNVPVERLGGQTRLKTDQPLKPAAARKLTAPERIAANNSLPAQTTGKRWREYISAMMPAEFAELQDSPVWGSDERMYRDELARELKRSMARDPSPSLSRRDNELGAFDPFANTIEEEQYNSEDDSPLTQEEMEDASRALAEAQGLSVEPPAKLRYETPSDAALKSVGIMAEAAYRPLTYSDDYGGGESATITFTGQRSYVFGLEETYDGKYRADPTYLGDLGPGAAYGISKVSRRFAEGWNQRVAASIDLMRNGFDLFTAVPAPSRKRVIEAWKRMRSLKGAAEFNQPDLNFQPGMNSQQRLQQIADSMLDGTRYRAAAGPGSSSGWWAVTITDSKTGAIGTAEIQYVGGADKRLVMHTQDFDKGSGLGKPFYQIAFALGHAIGVPTNADPAGLLGVNNYRRTEQMMSAAVRAGTAGAVNPGIGQRIYGWNKRAKDDTQRDRNLARIALAAARNAAEVAPKVRDLTYDVATDTFGWRPKTKQLIDAPTYVAEVLKSDDARAVSLSRSTLARAAITFMAIDGTLKLDEATEVKSPVLYSAREEEPQAAESSAPYADVDSAAAADSIRAATGLRVRVPVQDGAGQREITVRAVDALKDYDRRVDVMRLLVRCLSG